MVFAATGFTAPGPPSFAAGPEPGVCPPSTTRVTPTATATAARADTAITVARRLGRPRPLPGARLRGRTAPGGGVPGGAALSGPVAGDAGWSSSEPVGARGSPAAPGRGWLAGGAVCCQVRARIVWVGES